MRAQIVAAAACGFLLVAAGAIGAHLISPEAKDRWDSALVFGFVHTTAALGVALAPRAGWLWAASGWAFLAGVLAFSGIQLARMMTTSGGASPIDALGMLVPVGGFAFMAGWLLLAIGALRWRPGEKIKEPA